MVVNVKTWFLNIVNVNIISTGELKQQNDGFSPIIVDIFDDGTRWNPFVDHFPRKPLIFHICKRLPGNTWWLCHIWEGMDPWFMIIKSWIPFTRSWRILSRTAVLKRLSKRNQIRDDKSQQIQAMHQICNRPNSRSAWDLGLGAGTYSYNLQVKSLLTV
jgi:hypothetical protein